MITTARTTAQEAKNDMELVDRYLAAVRTYLPGAQQDDIINELSANIRAQMDDREEELGRPLTEAEQEAILQGYGHPMVVAGRYQTNTGTVAFGPQLIGPTLFPLYMRTLGIVLGISLSIYALVVVALAFGGVPTNGGNVVNSGIVQAAIQFAVITAIFAVVERTLPTMKWNAKDLPRQARTPAAARGGNQVSRVESFGQIVAIVVFAAWILGLVYRQDWSFGAAIGPFGPFLLGPIWGQLVLPTLALMVVGLVQATINLFHPEWALLPRITSILTDLGTLGIVVYLVLGADWVTLAPSNTDISADTLASINQYVHYGIIALTMGCAIVLLADLWRLVRHLRRPRSAMNGQSTPMEA